MDRGINITPLNDTNYNTWKVQVKMYLMREGLLDLVEGTETAPAPAAENANRDAIQKFNLRKNRALANIVLNIEPKLLYLLGDPVDPTVVWKKLQDTFVAKTWANKLRLKRKLYNMRLKEGDLLQNHLKCFIELYDELAVIGEKVEEEDKVINLLASLPDKFSTLVTALEASEKVPSWEVVTERLLHEENKLKVNLDVQEEKSLFAKGNKKEFKCYECGMKNHFRRNCPNLKNKNRKWNENKSKANVARDDDNIVLIASTNSAFSTTSYKNDSFIIDSGATNHLCFKKESFSNFQELNSKSSVQVGDGKLLAVEGKGDVLLNLKLPSGKSLKCQLKNVLYVPKLAHNLISVSQITNDGKTIKFFDESCKIMQNDRMIAHGTKMNNLFILDRVIGESSVALSSNVSESELWHRRFCHLGINNLNKIIKNDLVRGMKNVQFENVLCENCCDGKNHRLPFPHVENDNHGPLELIHSDVCGKIQPESLGGGQYFITFIDHFSRYCWVYIIKNKSDVFSTFKNWKNMVENLYERKIKRFRSDNGGEFCSKEFEDYMLSEGIIHQTTISKTPEQNGVAERKNRSLVEAVRCMISDSGLPKSFWAEAISTANYVINRSPSAAIKSKTPYEMLNNVKPNVEHFKIFGCESFVHIPKDERSKLDSKSKKCIFLGYANKKKGFRLYDDVNKKILHSRDVIFNEEKMFKAETQPATSTKTPVHPFEDSSDIDQEDATSASGDVEEEDDEEFQDAQENELRRSDRNRRPPERYPEWCNSAATEFEEPKSVEEALSGAEASQWLSAMESEMASMRENKVWHLVKPSPNQKLIKCKWLFKKKLSCDGKISFKARLVAQGYNQEYGVDFEETYSPVVRFESVRTLISLASHFGLDLHHMDVSTAFLNGKLTETVFMTQPEHFITKGKESFVCKLDKAIYGLKQSSKCWYDSFSRFLIELGFKPIDSDSCMYVYDSNNEKCIIALYVDDLLIGCNSQNFLKSIKSKLMSQYKMKDLGKVKQFLGVSFENRENDILIHQNDFTLALLKKFNFENCKAVLTPIDVSNKLSSTSSNDKLVDINKYQSAVGGLLYLATRTRPDISFAVGLVSKYCSKPSENHWIAVKRIFRYLKGTMSLGLSYEKTSNVKCLGYSDADWAGDVSDRKSTSGYCFSLGNCLVSWRSNKQTCVALSTAEAEYVALSAAAQEAVWLGKLLSELKVNNDDPILIYEDNQSAICLSKSNRTHSKSKHIDIKYNFIRDVLNEGKILIEYCPSADMLADIFTKGLSSERFCRLRMMLGMKSS